MVSAYLRFKLLMRSRRCSTSARRWGLKAKASAKIPQLPGHVFQGVEGFLQLGAGIAPGRYPDRERR